jgi:hypothetical protein
MMQKKLILNKHTLSRLTERHFNNALGWGDPYKCFENLWTLYYCDMIISKLNAETFTDNHAPQFDYQIKI